MTANATIQVAHVDNATIVPLTAFSYTPAAGTIAHTTRTAGATPWGATASTGSGAVTVGSTGRVFVDHNGTLTPVRVTIGIVADTEAAVTPVHGTLAAGDQIVVSDSRGASAHGAAASTSTRNLLSGTTTARNGPGR